MLKKLTEYLFEHAWSQFGVPVTSALLGSIGIFVVTLLIQRWVSRQHDAAVKLQSGETFLKTKHRFFLSEGRLLVTTVVWVRWFGIGVLFFYSMLIAIENLNDALLQFNDSQLRQYVSLSKRGGAHLRSWGKVGIRVFSLIIGTIWLTQFFENASQVIVNRYVLSRQSSRGKLRMQTLNAASAYAIRSIMITILFLSILQLVGLNIAPLLATAGVASIAIGFGAQTLVKDVLAGFFILLEDQFAVGDVISVDNRAGRVESMNLRVTRLRNGMGELLIVPNGEIRFLNNKTSGWSQVDVKLNVSYNTDIDKALAIFREELDKIWKERSDVILERPELVGVDKLLDSAVSLRAFIKTSPDSRWEIERQFNKQILERLNTESIKIQLPTREIWFHGANSQPEKPGS